MSVDRSSHFFFMSIMFYSKLVEGAPRDSARQFMNVQGARWTGGRDVFAHNFIVLPIFSGLHASVVIVCNPSAQLAGPGTDSVFPFILHLDSLDEDQGES